MKFSYNAVWEDTVRLARAHGPLFVAVAGAFIFLPSLLLAYLLPEPETSATDLNEAMRIAMDYYSAEWPWFLLTNLLAMLGSLTMLRLIFARQTTVGAAIAAAATLLPFYFLLSLITGFVAGIGLLLFILPGLYIGARLIIAGAVMVAENRRSPLGAISRTFEVTRGHGWAILGLVLLIALAALIVLGVVNGVFGIFFTLVLGKSLGELLMLIVSSATSAAFMVLFTVLYAAIYRALGGDAASTARVFE